MKDLVELVQDDDRLKQERKRAKKNRDKYKGVSSEDFSRGYSKFNSYNVYIIIFSSMSLFFFFLILFILILLRINWQLYQP